MFGNTALVHELPHLPVFRHTHRQTLTRIQRPFGPAVPADQQRCYRRSQRCQAEERSRDSTKTKETEKTVVPDTPPAQDSPARRSSDSVRLRGCTCHYKACQSCSEPSYTMQGTSTATEDSVEVSEELKLLQQRKRDSQASAPANYFEVYSSRIAKKPSGF